MFFQNVTHIAATCCMIFVGAGLIPIALFNNDRIDLTNGKLGTKPTIAIAEIAAKFATILVFAPVL